MKIICIEGLGGELGAWCRKPMIKAGFEVEWHPWWWVPKLPNGCNLFAHSLGGGKIIRLINEEKVKPGLLVTVDPRLEPEDGFSVPEGITAVNFYQKGFMRGYHVNGATNFTLIGRHTKLPSFDVVLDTVQRLGVR